MPKINKNSNNCTIYDKERIERIIAKVNKKDIKRLIIGGNSKEAVIISKQKEEKGERNGEKNKSLLKNLIFYQQSRLIVI